MKLEVDGKKYDLEEGMSHAELHTLFELKSKYGIGMKSMLKAVERMKGLDPMDLLEDVELFETFLAAIWLARRHAGEKLTLEEATSIPLAKLKFAAEEGDEVADPPQALTVSDQGDERPAGASTSKGTSKTSKRQ